MAITIGTIQAQANPSVAPTPKARGGGLTALAEGLNGIASALGQAATVASSEQDAIVNKQDRLDRASTMVEFTKMQGQWARDYLDQKTKAPIGDQTFQDRQRKELDTRANAFLQSVPDKLKPEFATSIEEFKQNQYNAILNDQVDLKTAKYNSDVTAFQAEIQNSIYDGKRRLEDWKPLIDDFFKNSPYDAETTKKLKDALLKDGSKLQIELDAAAEILHPERNQGLVDGLPAGMPAAAMGLVNALVGSEATDFNVMYGGSTFSSFADHPNQPHVITEGPNKGKTSTAAGLPQFVYGTWKRAQAALGLPDFSPANQIRAMWWVAQQDYKARTGRDLQSDMESGSPIILEGVRRNLAPTWEGFGKMSTEEFISKVTRSSAVPPSAFNDPSYDGLLPTEKRDVYEAAVARAREERNRNLAEQKQQQEAMVNNVLRAIQSGDVKPGQVDTFIQNGNLTAEQVDKIRTTQKTWDEETFNLDQYSRENASGTTQYSTEAKKGLNTFMARGGNAAIQNGDSKFVEEVLIPNVKKALEVPDSTIQTLDQMRFKGTPQQVAFAYATLDLLRTNAQQQFDALPKSIRDDAIYYGQMADYKEPGVIAEELKNMNSTEFESQRKILEPRLPAIYKDNASDFSIDTIMGVGRFGSSITADPAETTQLVGAFRTEFEYQFYRFNGDYDKAYAATQQIVASDWGTFDNGDGPYLQRYPITHSPISTIGETYDWIADSVRKDFSLGPEQTFQLKGDGQTKSEMVGGNVPSYLVTKKDSVTGLLLPMLGENGLPMRWKPSEDGQDAKAFQQEALSTDEWTYQRDRTLSLLNSASANFNINSQDTMAQELTALLQEAYAITNKNVPRFAKAGDIYGRVELNEETNVSPERVKEMLTKLGYANIESFAKDVGKYNYNDLTAILYNVDPRKKQ